MTTAQKLFRPNAAAFLLMFLATACDPSTATDAGVANDGGPPMDAQITDGAIADGAITDGAITDGAIADGAITDGAMGTVPTVLSNAPLDSAIDVAINTSVTVRFSEPMDRASLDADTFLLTSGDPAVTVTGTFVISARRAVFWPAANLASDTMYTGTITAGATSAGGIHLAADHVFRFTTGSTLAPVLPVNLGTAADFAILAKSAISTVPGSAITGDIGVSPAAATFITGFSLTLDSTNVFSRSLQVTGRVYAADYAVPTPSNMTTAIGDMELAYADAGSRPAGVTELGAGSIGGMTLAPGVYAWGTGLLLASDVTLNGSATDVWIFQIAQNLTLESGVRVNLTGGALPSNIFWQVAGLVDLGTTAHCEGAILTATAVTLRTGASVNGRLLAQTAVSLDTSVVVAPPG